MSKLAKYRSKRPAKKNPITESAIGEFGMQVGAGFVGYAATRLAMRMAYSQAIKRWPNAAPHLGVLASAASATGVYFGTQFWERAEPYHESAAIGAGIALIQAAFQTYVPKLGWIVADVDPGQYVTKTKLTEANLDDLSAFGIDDPPASLDTPTSIDRLLAADNEFEAIPVDAGGHEMAELADTEYGDDDLEHFNGMMN